MVNFSGLLTAVLSGLGSFTCHLIYCLFVAMLYSLSVVYAYTIVATLYAMVRVIVSYIPICTCKDHVVRVLSYWCITGLADRVCT